MTDHHTHPPPRLTRAQAAVLQGWKDAHRAVTALGAHQVRIGGSDEVAAEWAMFHVEHLGAVALDLNGKQVVTNGAAHLAAMRAACALGLPAIAPEVIERRRARERERDQERRRPQAVRP